MEKKKEAALIALCKKGDVDAFEELISQHQTKVLNTAFAMLGNREDAYDAAQEVFLKVFNSIDKFCGQSSFSTWLYRVTINVCLDELRKRKRHSEGVVSISADEAGDFGELQIADTGAGPPELIELTEVRQTVLKAIQSLDEQHRTVIILRELYGLNYKQIADILSCSLGTVKSRISRARRDLKKRLIKNKELF